LKQYVLRVIATRALADARGVKQPEYPEVPIDLYVAILRAGTVRKWIEADANRQRIYERLLQANRKAPLPRRLDREKRR
jgi:hypothetical protein